MSAARGIAGSVRPEVEGCFLAEEWEVDWFVQMNNTGGPVDVWAVDGVEEADLRDNGNGCFYLPAAIPREWLVLIETDLPPAEGPPSDDGASPVESSAYRSTLIIWPAELPAEADRPPK